jgi:hypothetical protein
VGDAVAGAVLGGLGVGVGAVVAGPAGVGVSESAAVGDGATDGVVAPQAASPAATEPAARAWRSARRESVLWFVTRRTISVLRGATRGGSDRAARVAFGTSQPRCERVRVRDRVADALYGRAAPP